MSNLTSIKKKKSGDSDGRKTHGDTALNSPAEVAHGE